MTWRASPLILSDRSGWRAPNVPRLWEYRDLLVLLGLRELRLRYRQTLLGIVWVILQPLLGAAAIAFVFGRVAGVGGDGTPYILVAFTGLLGWSVFSATLTKATSSLVYHPQLITKVSFPRLIIPFSAGLAPAVDFAVSSVVLLILLQTYGFGVPATLLLLPLWLLGLLALSLGLGFFLSGLAVAYRDVPHLLPFALQMLLFLSPIAYPTDAVPERIRAVYRLNPLAVMIEGLRDASLGRAADIDIAFLLAIGLTLIFFFGGWLFFENAERRFADVI